MLNLPIQRWQIYTNIINHGPPHCKKHLEQACIKNRRIQKQKRVSYNCSRIKRVAESQHDLIDPVYARI